MAIFVLLLLTLVSGEKWSGSITRTAGGSDGGLWFLGKFCFEKDPSDVVGSIDITLTSPTPENFQNTQILLYLDTDDGWAAVWGKDLTCDEWESYALPGGRSLVTWTNGSFHYLIDDITEHTRPHFWFVALSTCDPAAGTGWLDYDLHFLQVKQNSWNHEFGWDIIGLNTMFLIFFIYYTIFLSIHYYGVFLFWKTQNYIHPLIRLFAGILAVEYIFIFSKLIHYAVFANDGKGVVFFDYLGDVLEVINRLLFILMIMLLALGWTITNDTLPGKGCVLLTCIIFLTLWLAILIWKLAVQDPAEIDLPYTLRVMELILLVFWFFLAAWFIVTVGWNYKKEDNPVKKLFYKSFGIFYTLWFLGLPLAVAISLSTENWVRTKVNVSVSVCISTVAFSAMAYFLWPSRAEEWFKVEKPNIVNTGLQHYEHL